MKTCSWSFCSKNGGRVCRSLPSSSHVICILNPDIFESTESIFRVRTDGKLWTYHFENICRRASIASRPHWELLGYLRMPSFKYFQKSALIFNININKALFIIVFIIESLLVGKLVPLINIFYNLSVIVFIPSSRLISEIFPSDWLLTCWFASLLLDQHFSGTSLQPLN